MTGERLVVGVTATIVAIIVTIIAITLNRGFDSSDEAFVDTMISSNRSGPTEFWGFQFLLHPLYQVLGSNVLAFRIIRLLGYVALGVALTFVAKRALDSLNVTLRRSSWAMIAFIAQVGTFAAWSYPPRYLGYNELASWLAQLGGALLILLLVSGQARATRPLSRISTSLLWAIIGILIAVLFFAKFTSAILFAVIALPVALLPRSDGGLWKRLGTVAGGAIVTLIAMLAAGIPVLSYSKRVAKLFLDTSAQESSGYSLSELTAAYVSSAALTVTALAVPTVLITYVLFANRGLFNKGDDFSPPARAATLERIAVALGALLILIVLLPRTERTWDALGISLTLMFVITVIVYVVLDKQSFTAVPQATPSTLAIGVGFFVLALAPLVSAVGTNNPLFGQVVFSATLWAVAAGVALCLSWERANARSRTVRSLPLLLVGALVASSALSVAADVFVHPYRTQPYFDQNSVIEAGELRGIRVTPSEAELYNWLHTEAAREKAQNQPAISLASAGTLFAFNASGWASPWTGPSWSSSITQACGVERPSSLFVLQPASQKRGSALFDGLVAGLDPCGISFPEDFSIVSQHHDTSPDRNIKIWRLN